MHKFIITPEHLAVITVKATKLGLTPNQYIKRALILSLNIDDVATEDSFVVIENNGEILANIELKDLNSSAKI